MSELRETRKVVNPLSKSGFTIIAAEDFDPQAHRLFEEKTAASTEATEVGPSAEPASTEPEPSADEPKGRRRK